jgi:hypothetical protein
MMDDRYADRSHTYDSWCPSGVRGPSGRLACTAVGPAQRRGDTGLRVRRVVEDGPGGVPDVLGLLAIKEA